MISHCQLLNMPSGSWQIDFEEAGSECPVPTEEYLSWHSADYYSKVVTMSLVCVND